LAKLHSIEKVKSFGAKLQIDLLGNGRPFEQCGVIVGDSLGAQRAVGARLISEAVIGWLGEATGVEPAVLPGNGVSRHILVATWSQIGPWSAGAKLLADKCGLGGKDQRKAKCVGGDSIDAPTGNHLVHDSALITQEALAFADGQVIDVSSDEALRNVVAELRVLRTQVVPVLNFPWLHRLLEARLRVCGAHVLGPGVRCQYCAARGKAFFDLGLERVVVEPAAVLAAFQKLKYCGYGRNSWPAGMVGPARLPEVIKPWNGFGTGVNSAEPRERSASGI